MIIVVAPYLETGRTWSAVEAAGPVTIVTPRCIHRVRGIQANGLVVLSGVKLSSGDRDALYTCFNGAAGDIQEAVHDILKSVPVK